VDEIELVEKFKLGDTRVFKDIFNLYKDAVMSVCYRIVGNKVEAEDLCQEVFFKVYKSLNSFQAKSKLSTWIYRIALNQSLNSLRKKKKFREINLDPQNKNNNETDLISSPEIERPDRLFEKKEKEKVIWEAVQSLPKNQRVAIILQKYEGLSCEEIAGIMEATLFSIQSLIHRGKKNLYKKLLPYLNNL
jgi:RNA polymerase sigma-70 factor (ECF subfamily)